MSGRICLSPQAAFEAGFEAACEHRVPDPTTCPQCRLTDAEIRRLAVLLRGEPAAEAAVRSTAA